MSKLYFLICVYNIKGNYSKDKNVICIKKHLSLNGADMNRRISKENISRGFMDIFVSVFVPFSP